MAQNVPQKARRHDHRACVHRAIADAEQACRKRGLRLTPLRQRVLELVWSGHAAVKAYDLLRRLQHEREGAAPPTVYRALDFLSDAGLIHRIESLNAFVGCSDPLHPHRGQFLICRLCRTVTELEAHDTLGSLSHAAKRVRFQVERQTIEAYGLCASCQSA